MSGHFRRRALLQSRRALPARGYGAPAAFLQSLGERRPRGLAGTCSGRPPCRRAVSTASEMRVTWIGHATVLVQTQGLNILTDPIWSDRASPFSLRRARSGCGRRACAFDDLPRIDLVLISHNHYDHLDLPTLQAAVAARSAADRHQPRQRLHLAGGRHRARRALDWGGRIDGAAERRSAGVERNHHWSSRWGTDRNRALWSAFTIRLPGRQHLLCGRHRLWRRLLGAGSGRATVHSGSRSSRSAPTSRAIS